MMNGIPNWKALQDPARKDEPFSYRCNVYKQDLESLLFYRQSLIALPDDEFCKLCYKNALEKFTNKYKRLNVSVPTISTEYDIYE